MPPLVEPGEFEDVFDVDKQTDYVVFIMDISKSMQSNNKLERTKRVLRKAINELNEEANFQVIFFAKDARFAAGDWNESEQAHWLEATRENKEITDQEISNLELCESNQWDKPFMLATSIKGPAPKRIDFLTDGSSKGDAELVATAIISLLKRTNKDINVNTTVLIDKTSIEAVKLISDATNGKHTYIEK